MDRLQVIKKGQPLADILESKQKQYEGGGGRGSS